MEAERTKLMDWSNTDGTAMATAFILLLAIAVLGGLTLAFSGSIHF